MQKSGEGSMNDIEKKPTIQSEWRPSHAVLLGKKLWTVNPVSEPNIK